MLTAGLNTPIQTLIYLYFLFLSLLSPWKQISKMPILKR